jgi:hypothetical protein
VSESVSERRAEIRSERVHAHQESEHLEQAPSEARGFEATRRAVTYRMPKCDARMKYLPATFAWALLLSTTTLFFYFP